MKMIIEAREDDKGNLASTILILFVMSLVGGFGGIPIGAILSAVMQRVLNDSSPLVMYGFFIGPIILGMILVLIYIRKDISTTNHTFCEKCKKKMTPMTEMDTLFSIPVTGEQSYTNPLSYLAQNMVRISSVREIPENGRGCYVCCYTCHKCSNRMVRIADFAPFRGQCKWKNSYYFDFAEFIQARAKNDLL